jgi:hypothetical protein
LHLDDFLSLHPSEQLVQQALSYRAETEALQGDLVAAKVDFLKAVQLTPSGSYARYALHLRLGRLGEESGSLSDARTHYLKAMRTVLHGSDLSGGTALACLLRLSEDHPLTKKEVQLAEKVVRQSWKALGIHGAPKTKDLRGAAKILAERQSRSTG